MDFLNSIPTWVYMFALFTVLAGIVFAIENKKEENNPDLIKETGMTDYITCSVPGQKVVYLRPQDYISYTGVSYGSAWEITLKNGNTLYLPIEYTTIIDDSFKQIATI